MSLQREDIEDRLTAQESERQKARVHQLKIVAAVGQTMSELKADPRWEVWGRHLELMRQQNEDLAHKCELLLLGPKMLDPKEYAQLKVDLTRYRAYSDAYSKALEVAQTLIERGAQALKEIEGLPQIPLDKEKESG